MKLDLAGVLSLIAQLQSYEAGQAVSIPLDLTAQLAACHPRHSVASGKRQHDNYSESKRT